MSEALETGAVAEVSDAEVTTTETSGEDSGLVENSQNPFEEVNSELENVDSEIEALEEEIEDADTEEEVKEVEKEIKRLKKLKLKYNGQEFEEELPFEIDDNPEVIEYLTRKLQLAKMGQHKSQELSNVETDIRTFFDELRADPKGTLSNPGFGLDLKELAAQIVEEELENAAKSPEQLERESLEKELKQMKDERTKEQEEFRKVEMERLQNQEYERFDMLMTQALDNSDLPKTPYVVKKMADYMIQAVQNGYDVEPADILPIVREEVLNDVRSMFSVMDAEQLIKIIGNDQYDKVRKHKLSKGRKKKTAATNKKSKDVGAVKAEAKKEVEPSLTIKDWLGV